MKRCPLCSQVFDAGIEFCVDDGAVLVPNGLSYAEVPTQVFIASVSGNRRPSDKPNLLYVGMGAMGAVVIGLTVALFYISSGPKNSGNSQAEVKAPLPSAPAASTPVPDAAPRDTQLKTPPISVGTARELIGRWEAAQNARSFALYRACYSSTFLGIKETRNGSRQQMNYGSWMADRGAMMRNVIEVRVENPEISIDGDVAVARFTQNWRSTKYCDVGEKTLRIKMFEDGPKIVFEELKGTGPCG